MQPPRVVVTLAAPARPVGVNLMWSPPAPRRPPPAACRCRGTEAVHAWLNDQEARLTATADDPGKAGSSPDRNADQDRVSIRAGASAWDGADLVATAGTRLDVHVKGGHARIAAARNP
jgi:hypothetical protein